MQRTPCIHNETRASLPDGNPYAGAPNENYPCNGRVRVSARRIYKGYTFADVSTPTESGRYRARVAILALDGERTRSQRFIDLEVFKTRQEASDRVVTVAKAWIDENAGNDRLCLPTNFTSLE